MDQWQHIINNAYSALLGSYNSAIAKQEKGTVLDKVNAELLKNLIYNPATKQVFPQSPLHEKDPEKLAMNLVVGMAEPIKEKTPLTADWDTAVDIVRSAGTKGQASLDDIMKAVDTVKAEMGRQMTPEELAKNKSIDRAIDMIQPRVDAEMGGKLPKQLPKGVEGLAGDPYYHATTVENAQAIKQRGFLGRVGERSKASHGDMQKGVFLYPKDREAAEVFGKNLKNPTVLETRIKGKVYDANTQTKYGWEDNLQTQEIASNKKVLEQLRKDGYVGVTSTELGQPSTFVFDTKAIDASDIFNQSKGVQSKGGVK